MRVIAYVSRGLSRSESRYLAHKLEFLALKWAIAEKFSDYLYGSQFTVITDSNPPMHSVYSNVITNTGPLSIIFTHTLF